MLQSKRKKRSVCSTRCIFNCVAYTCIIGILSFCFSLVYLSSNSEFWIQQIGNESLRSQKKVAGNIKTGKLTLSNRYEHRFHRRHVENSSVSVGDLYYVIAEKGVKIYDRESLILLDHIDIGSIVVTERTQTKVTWISLSQCESGYCSSLLIIFPIPGVVFVDDYSQTLQSLNIVIDRRCRESSFKANADITGGDLPNMPIAPANARGCCYQCLQQHKCDSWTFTPEGSCWLKQTLRGEQTEIKPLARKENLISGYVYKFSEVNTIPTHSAGNHLMCCSSHQRGGDRGNTTRSDLLHIELQSINSNPSILRIQRDSISWNEQWPIGNGKFGALVGGLFDREVIPVSISGLFMRRKSPPSTKKSFGSRYSAFTKARNHLLNNQIHEAQMSVAGMKNDATSLGMFQYIADISFLYSVKPIYSVDPTALNDQNMMKVAKSFPEKRSQRVLHPLHAPREGREGIFDVMHSKLNITEMNQGYSSNALFTNTYLNIKTGIAVTEILHEVNSLDEEEAIIKASRREWFASEVDDVIAGRITMVCYIYPYSICF